MVNEQEYLQEIEQPVEVEEQVQDVTPVAPARNAESHERNLRNLREKYERSEREKSELIKLLQERNAVPQQPDTLDFSLGDDEIVEGKHISKVKKQMRSELSKIQEELNAMKQHSRQLTAENKVRNKYPDMDTVLSPNNIEMLKDIDPDTAASIANLSDPYAQFTLAYLAVKEKVLNQTSAPFTEMNDRVQAHKNIQKPKTATSINPQQGENPLVQANLFGKGLTPELTKKLREEMDTFARRV